MKLEKGNRMLYIVVLLMCGLIFSGWMFVRMPKFGQLPEGERLERIRKSPHYDGQQFMNLSPTPAFAEDASVWKTMVEFFIKGNPRREPDAPVPSVKIDLRGLHKATDCFVWLGHGAYYFQSGGRRFLVDPVLSDHASPVSFTTRSFPGSDVYQPDDLPDIDYLLITHDHWDHLDFATLRTLRPRIGKVITGLGVGAHLEHWGFSPEQIIEGDWYDGYELESGFKVVLTPARHFSGRLFKRNQTLWVSFVVKTPTLNLFLSGDGGYDSHFEAIGREHGPFDYAVLECGQYNESWRYIHMMPHQVIKAAIELQTACFVPVHWGKFQLANHDWDEPIRRVSAMAVEQSLPMISPVIGASVPMMRAGNVQENTLAFECDATQ
ncbi:L-ascorbate metabolism protein UlaG (beta-lactamase superfamily) [Breznakibacter xylanolyticus]|uniref:L-ascorbate metabolism protein UlaG (Beta-lactamase superfamily) n=1 Tax=Breznakibacter xylanolyticus TaxID=990 RepID=A0A2W7QER4_9BACT|nr:MBL fold metallo-hydrolase [Breznakibacter xylanolyticus]PZX20409.1 L-ascorbate metabolism protein UlaG (beta-lactamase superfamily) [Breznakibacter xylanolyticus]